MTKTSGNRHADRVISGGTPDGTAALNFDDDEIYSGRSSRAHTGGTTAAQGGDSAPLGPPSEQLSASNGPSDPDAPPSRERV